MNTNSEYNPNLQQAPGSAVDVVIPNMSYSVAEDIERAGQSIGNLLKINAKSSEAERKAKATALETEFDNDVARVLEESQRKPNASQSDIQNEMNKVIWDPKYSLMSMATKNAILDKRNYKHVASPAILAGEEVSKYSAEKAAAKEKRYVDLAITSYGPEVSKMSYQAQVDAGKKLASQQEWTLRQLPTALADPQMSTQFKRNLSKATADDLVGAVGRDLVRNVNNITPEWLAQYKAETVQGLLQNSDPANPIPMEYATYIVETAAEPFGEILEVIKQGREDTVKYVQQRAQISEGKKNIVASEQELAQRLGTGTTLTEHGKLMDSYTYIKSADPAAAEKLLKTGALLYNTMLKVQEGNVGGVYNLPQGAYNATQFFFNYPLATSAQKANNVTEVNNSLATNFEEAKKTGEAKSKEYQDAMSYNTRTLMNEIADNAPALTNGLKTGTPEQVAFFKQNFNRNLNAAIENDIARLGRDAFGVVTYEDGVLKSTDKRDRGLIQEVNSLLESFRKIEKNVGVPLIDEQAFKNTVNTALAEEVLNLPLTEGTMSDLKFLNPAYSLQMGVNRLFGLEGDVAALRPREAVKLERNRAKMKKLNSENARKTRMEQAFGEGTYTPETEKGFWNWLANATGIKETEGSTLVLRTLGAPVSAAGTVAEGAAALVTLATAKGSEALAKAYRDFDDWSKMDKDTKQRIKNEEGVLIRPKKGNLGYGFNLEEIQKLSPEIKERLEAIEPGFTSADYLDKYQASQREYLGGSKMDALFDVLYEVAEEDARVFAGAAWDNLSDARKQALIDMAYNHGRERLMKYKEVKKALDAGNYTKAAEEILNSKYGKETHKNRARRNAALMLKGEF